MAVRPTQSGRHRARATALALLASAAMFGALPQTIAPASAQLIERSPNQLLAQVAVRLAAARTTVERATPQQMQQAVAAEVLANPESAPGILGALADVATNEQIQAARRGALDGVAAAVRRGRITAAVGQRLSSSIGTVPRGTGINSFPPVPTTGRGGGYLN